MWSFINKGEGWNLVYITLVSGSKGRGVNILDFVSGTKKIIRLSSSGSVGLVILY